MQKPLIIDFKSHTLEGFKKSHTVLRVIDNYETQLEDLFLIRNPRYKFNKDYKKDLKDFIDIHSQEQDLSLSGKWVFFPWNGSLVHYLEDNLHQEIRTSRNKNMILPEEQNKFYNFKVGVAGLSVGSHGALTIALMGGAKKIKLADPDIISPSNLNRMRFDFTQIGANKSELVAQYIYQLNPYADVEIYAEGINDNNVDEFMEGLDILVEELDDIGMKVKLRNLAKKLTIPVVMATDNGDGVILDIERYDLKNDLPIFHGNLEGFDIDDVKKSPKKMYEAMARIIDVTLVPTRMLHSVNEVGRTIYSWPQLATAATLSGAILAYTVKKICLGEKINDGKIEFDFDSVLDPDYELSKEARIKAAKDFLTQLGA